MMNPFHPQEKTRIVNLIFDDPEARDELLGQFTQETRERGGRFTLVECLETFTHLYDAKINDL